ncbi:Virulence sensor protein BvgS precursor [compost metagenome]
MDDCLFKPIGLRTLKMHLPQARTDADTSTLPASGFHLSELRHLTQDDPQLIRYLLEQLAQSASEDLASLRALGTTPDSDTLGRIAHRIKGGAKMLKVRGVVSDCEAIEHAQAQGLPTQALRQQLETSLLTLQRELADSLSAIATSN